MVTKLERSGMCTVGLGGCQFSHPHLGHAAELSGWKLSSCRWRNVPFGALLKEMFRKMNLLYGRWCEFNPG